MFKKFKFYSALLTLTLVGFGGLLAQPARPPLTTGKIHAYGLILADSGVVSITTFDFKRAGWFATHNDTLKMYGLLDSLYISMQPPTLNYVLAANSRGRYIPTNPSSLGLGTVTSVSHGNLQPLLTASVATATTTPAITLAKTTINAHRYFGNSTAGATTWDTTAIGIGDLPVSLTRRSPVFKWTKWTTAGGTVDSQYVCTIHSGATLDSIVAFQLTGTVTMNFYRNRGGTVVAFLSATVSIGNSAASCAGLQNASLLAGDQIWAVVKTNSGAIPDQINNEFVYRITD